MKTLKIILFLALTLIMHSTLEAFTPTHHQNDWYTVMTYAEENVFLAMYGEEDREYIRKISKESLVPVKFLYRLHKIESQMNPNAVRQERNGSTSVGYSQINSVNFRYFEEKFNGGKSIDYYNKYENIRVGALYLRYLYERCDGNWISGLICYNWGPSNLNSGKTIPTQCIDYAFSIIYGPDYFDCVTTITGAIKGMI